MKFKLPVLFAAAIFLSACGNNYNTQFPAPTGEEKYSDIIPSEIGGEPVSSVQLELDEKNYYGSRFSFGDVASIDLVQCSNQGTLDTYFEGTVIPELEEGYNSKVSGKFNGLWSARASGSDGRIHAWQNVAYVFVIRADSDEIFDEIVEKFPYIAKK